MKLSKFNFFYARLLLILMIKLFNLTFVQNIYDKPKSFQTFENVTFTLENLLKNYDIRLRPKFGSEPLNVSMEVRIASFDGISEVNMDYTITIYLNQYWTDERLVFGSQDEYLTLMGDFADHIWVPDTFFANDKYAFLHDVTEKNKMIKIYGNGDIIYGMRFTTTLACMMDLHNYPLDSQNCTIEIESYGYTKSEVNINWKNDRDSVFGVDKVHLPQFHIADYKTSTYIEETKTGQYARLSLSFLLQRHIGYFIFQTYLPSILIVMLSWVSFWINHEATSARVALGITTVLTMTTISTGVRSSLPRISYVKAIDIYLVTCFVFVFSALLEYAAVNYTYWSERAKKRKRINQIINQNIEECFSGNNQPGNTRLDEEDEETSFMNINNTGRLSPLPWLYNKSSLNNNIDSLTTVQQPEQQFQTLNKLNSSLKHRSNLKRSVFHGHKLPNNTNNSKLKVKYQNELLDSYDSNNNLDETTSENEKDHSKWSPTTKNKKSLNRRSFHHSRHHHQHHHHHNYQYKNHRRNAFQKENQHQQQQKRIWESLRYKAKEIKKIIPSVRDINIIDKYSRFLFPILFLLFNLCYWCFYFFQSSNYSNNPNNLN